MQTIALIIMKSCFWFSLAKPQNKTKKTVEKQRSELNAESKIEALDKQSGMQTNFVVFLARAVDL